MAGGISCQEDNRSDMDGCDGIVGCTDSADADCEDGDDTEHNTEDVFEDDALENDRSADSEEVVDEESGMGDQEDNGEDNGGEVDCAFAVLPGCEPLQRDCCGNQVCSVEENCWDCPEDCGNCYQPVWSVRLPEPIVGPALAADGGFIVSGSEKIYWIDAAGNIIRQKPIGAYGPGGVPVMLPDGIGVVQAGKDGFIYWLDSEGTTIQRKKYADDPGYPLDSRYILASSSLGVVLAYTAYDQQQRMVGRTAFYHHSLGTDWSVDSLEWHRPTSHAAIDSGGNIVVTVELHSMQVVKYDPSGQELWSRVIREGQIPTPDDWGINSASIGFADSIIVGLRDGRLLSFSSEGDRQWELETGLPVFTEVAVGPDGTIYFGTLEGYLVAVNRDGRLLWISPVGICQDTWPFPLSVASAPLVLQDGVLLAPAGGNYLDAVRAADGARLYRIEIPEAFGFQYSPVMTNSGLMAIVEWDRLYAVQTTHSGPESGYWVRWLGDCQNRNHVGATKASAGRRGATE